MKLIWLSLHNVVKIYKKHLLVFLLILTSMSVSSFGLLFYSGYSGRTCAERDLGKGDCLKIILAESVENKSLIKMLDELVIKQEQLDHLKLSSFQDSEERSETENSGQGTEEIENEISVTIVGEYNKKYQNRLLIGRNLTYEDTEALVMIPSELTRYLEYDDVPINATLDFGKDRLKVSGILSYTENNEVVVPIKYYIEMFHGKYLEAGFNGKLTREQRNQVDNILASYQNVDAYNWILMKPTLLSFDFWVEFFQILMIFLVIIINIFVIIYFLMLRMKQTYSIYLICGGGSKEILFIITLQAFFIMLLGILIGFVGFVILLPSVKSMNLLFQGSIFFYIAICILIAVATWLLSLITCNKVNHNIVIYRTSE